MYTLLTGASSGVGREIAIYLSQSRKMILNGRNIERLKETRDLCKNNDEIILWPFDLSDYKSIEEHLSQLVKEKDIFISGFVHCAGVIGMFPLRSVNPDIIESVFSVNVFAAELIMKVLASKKTNNKSLKSAVFISSNISNRGAAAFSVYGSSKAALDGVMRNLSIELAPNTRVNTILPGGMITDMTKSMYDDPEFKAACEKTHPLGVGSPADIAPMVDFLLSERARWITGQQITIDGGRTIDLTEGRK